MHREKVSPSNVAELIRDVFSLVSKKLDNPNPCWYRGQQNNSWPLLPSIYRNQYSKLKSLEDSAINDYFIHASPFLDKLNFDGWDWYALMQHHGMPTRLLDWTESLINALYFCFENPLKNENKLFQPALFVLDPAQLNLASTNDESVILVFNQSYSSWLPESLRLNKNYEKKNEPQTSETIEIDNKVPLAIRVRFSNARIKAQNGFFTMHGLYEAPLEEYFEQKNISTSMKIDICKPEDDSRSVEKWKLDLYSELRALGVSPLSIYQDLVAVKDLILDDYITLVYEK